MKPAANPVFEVPKIGTLALVCIQPDRVNEFWPIVESFIERAFFACTADETPEDVHADLLANRALLWLVWDEEGKSLLAAGTSKIVKTPVGKVCIFASCAGKDMKLWIRFIDALEQYAKSEGCRKSRVYGRPGWERILRGYTKPWVTLEKDLGD